MDNLIIPALLATLGTWFVTALGAATVVFFTSPKPKFLNLMLGFGEKLRHFRQLSFGLYDKY